MFIKNVLVPQISKMTDGSHYLRVVWFGLPKSVNPLRKALLFSLLQIGKLRLREVRLLAYSQGGSLA